LASIFSFEDLFGKGKKMTTLNKHTEP